jgi:site-specific DNA-cytosine methylase
MKSFDLFAGYGGFTLALEKIYDNLGDKVRGTQSVEERKQNVGVSLRPESKQRNKSECIGFSEIDKYASAVLKYHWPNIKNY